MNLWIRTQDRKKLVLINTLAIADDDLGSILVFGIDGHVKVELGDYDTEERALEILDEIQRRLIKLQLVSLEEKGKARKDAVINDNLKCVYEMPEE